MTSLDRAHFYRAQEREIQRRIRRWRIRRYFEEHLATLFWTIAWLVFVAAVLIKFVR